MTAETISIIISVVTVGVAVGTLSMAGIKKVRQDMDRLATELREDMRELRDDVREVRRDVNTLREAVGALKEGVTTLKEVVGALKERVASLGEVVGALKERVASLGEVVGALKEQRWGHGHELKKATGRGMATERTELGREIETALREVLAHVRGEVNLARRIVDTLSGLAAASANAQDSGERGLAIRALAKQRWRVALHLEQQTGSALRPQAINSADVLQKLRRQLKAIDAKPLVLNRQTSNLAEPWTVQ